jgi:hypothetical protein
MLNFDLEPNGPEALDVSPKLGTPHRLLVICVTSFHVASIAKQTTNSCALVISRQQLNASFYK